MARLKENKPTADVLMNSMRAMGYSFEAAIADIVDNSVSAQAKNIMMLKDDVERLVSPIFYAEDTPLLRKGVNRMALCLFEHNEKAYHAAVRMMERYGKKKVAPF